MLLAVGLLLAILAVYVVRKIFDRKRGTRFPIEDNGTDDSRTVIVEE